jgi:hypothetical protein
VHWKGKKNMREGRDREGERGRERDLSGAEMHEVLEVFLDSTKYTLECMYIDIQCMSNTHTLYLLCNSFTF